MKKVSYLILGLSVWYIASMGQRAAATPYQAAQQAEIRGLVSDTTGKPLSGVSVRVKNQTNIGTSTDLNGRYVLQVPRNAVITVSMVGFEPQEINTADLEVINIVLKESESMLDDVVITAFGGATKRTDMIGSVVSVKPSELKIPSSNLTTALAGRVAGMIAYQRSGEPGQDNADFFIRGVTTFGYKVDPLILIDNVEVTKTDLARLQVDDIASFSILKDATATAIYGARGANGVILVTTKSGAEGRTKLNFRIENSFSAPVRSVELADPITYMQLANESVLTRDPKGQTLYPIGKIERTAAGDDPYLYPNVDWQHELMKDYTTNQRANLSVTGGGSVAQFFVSGAFNQDNGVLKVPERSNFNNNINLKNYSLRANVNMNLTKTTEFIVRLNGSFDDYTGPIDGGEAIYKKIMRTSPTLFAPYYAPGPDQAYIQHILFGNAGTGDYLNPYADLVKGYKNYSRSMMLAQLELKQNLSFITEGLSFRSLANTTRNSYFDVTRQYNPFFYQIGGINPFTNAYVMDVLNENTGTEYLDYSEGTKTVSTMFYMENALNYNRTFADKHTLSGLLVFILRNNISGNSGSLQQSLPFRNVGLSGRFTYAFKSKYFAEFNFGYNGSERFYKDQRYGFFPSAGLAWTVSNENFWDPLKSVVTNFRIRGTYGVVGNDAVGSENDRFLYLSEVNMNDGGRSSTFGTDNTYSRTGISVSRYANPYITWERGFKSNLAFEVSLFDKIQIMADLYKEDRKNIFMPRADIPTTMGLNSQVSANLGEAVSSGIDLSVDYNRTFNNSFWIQARGNFTYAASEYKVYEEPVYPVSWLSHEGYSLSQQWGYIAERLFVDDEEVANSPSQIFPGDPVRGGDIKFKDLNGDGQITSLDRAPIGYPTTPQIVYGFGFSVGYKGFDFSSFFQGLAQESFWIDTKATAPFISYRYDSEIDNGQLAGMTLQNQLLKAYADNHWSEDNRDIYALWPRLSSNAPPERQNSNNQQRSTWFMRDGAFVRLKQVEIGYTLPNTLTERLRMSMLRFYLNGTNLLTFSGFKLWDPEMAGNGLGYPVQRVFNIGINASF